MGPVSDRIGRKTPLYFGLALYVVASLACVFEHCGPVLAMNQPLWLLMSGLFLVVSGIGLTGPNAMALAMSKQGAKAGTASAIMGVCNSPVACWVGYLKFPDLESITQYGIDDVDVYQCGTICNFKVETARQYLQLEILSNK